MKPRKTTDIISVLKRKGFQQTASHHRYLHLFVEDATTEIYTFVSHGIEEYGNDLLSKMKKQLGFSDNKEFEKFLDCPMTFEEYVSMLSAADKIRLPEVETSKKQKK